MKLSTDFNSWPIGPKTILLVLKIAIGDFYVYDIMDEQGNVLDSCAGFDDLLVCSEQGKAEAKSLSQNLCVAAGI